MQRALFGIILAITLISASCTQRMVCPAFQSAYIYDRDQLRKKFSYFLEDSTPKIYSASKTKYLIAESTTYKKKVRAIKTVEMKPVNVAVPDSLLPNFDEDLGKEGADGEDGVVPGAELDAAARSVIDSTYIVDVPVAEEPVAAADSIYVISKDRELRLLKYNFPDSLQLDSATGRYVSETPYYAVVNVTFNVEQDNYMWYLRDYLVLPDVRLAQIRGRGGETEGEGDEGTEAKKGKKKGGFFKNLFKKKKVTEEPEEEAVPPPPKSEEEEFDYIEEDEQGQPPVTEEEQPKEEKKKGLFGRKKDKKPKEEKPKEEKPREDEPSKDEETEEDPADEIPEKVEEDGF
jgi:hypothetical protein